MCGYAQPALKNPVGKKAWSYVSTPILPGLLGLGRASQPLVHMLTPAPRVGAFVCGVAGGELVPPPKKINLDR